MFLVLLLYFMGRQIVLYFDLWVANFQRLRTTVLEEGMAPVLYFSKTKAKKRSFEGFSKNGSLNVLDSTSTTTTILTWRETQMTSEN